MVNLNWIKIILNRDHAGGNEKLIDIVGKKEVVGGDDRIGALTRKVGHGDKLKVKESSVWLFILVRRLYYCLFTSGITNTKKK